MRELDTELVRDGKRVAFLVGRMDRVDGSGLHWWLYGSAALAVRGLDSEPDDLDLHVDDAAFAGTLVADLLGGAGDAHWLAGSLTAAGALGQMSSSSG